MKPETMILIGTLSGALIGAITTLVSTWIMKHYENKRIYHQMLIEMGIKNWEGAKDWAISLSKNGESTQVYPLELFIAHQAKISQLIINEKLTPETLKKVKEESEELNKIYEKSSN